MAPITSIITAMSAAAPSTASFFLNIPIVLLSVEEPDWPAYLD